MKLKFQNGNVIHTSLEIGNAFLAAGLAAEVFPAPPPLLPTRWDVGIDTESGAAYIHAHCANGLCGNNRNVQHRAFGPNAYKLAFSHCGKNEMPPEDIVKRFRAARENPEREE